MPDPAWIGSIAREVIRRLQRETAPPASTAPVKLVTVETLERLGGAGEIRVSPSCVVTPAASEEAVRRGIKLVREASAAAPQAGSPANPPAGPPPDQRDDVLAAQLTRRNITLPPGIDVVWTETPAAEVYRHCAAGRPAVMITAYADVERFAAELSPRVWVLDAQRLSLVAATNAAARIARLASTDHGGNR
jgi:hypothetical protein